MLIRGAEIAGQRLDLRCEAGRIGEIGRELAPRADEPCHEAAGGALLPGLHDHHLHLFSLAASLASIHCGPPQIENADALARALREARPSDGWLRGTGYFESVAGPLDRARLDALSGDTPLRIQHRSGVLWFLNSAAIRALSLDDPGSPRRISRLPEIERDASGRATGRLFRADGWLRERLPRTRPPDLRAAAHRLARFGVTGMTDATVSNDLAQAELFRAAQRNGDLPQRVRLMGDGSLTLFDADARLAVDARKFLLDEPALPELDALVAEIVRTHASGRGCAFHCVTRVELHFALAALEAAGAHALDRIEHASVATSEAIARVKQLGIRVVTQPNFGFERGDDYLREVEARDQPDLYRVRAWLEAGVPLAAGTDAPYGDPDPWQAMRAAVTRRTRRGALLGESERVSPEAAFALFLPGSAADARSEIHSRIAVGQPADLCLLDRPWQAAREALSSEGVAATFCAGSVVYSRGDTGESSNFT